MIGKKPKKITQTTLQNSHTIKNVQKTLTDLL